MAHGSMVTSSYKNNEHSDSRNSPCYIEIREYRFREDAKGNYNSKAPSSHTTSKATSVPYSPSYPDPSLRNSHNSEMVRGRSVWKSSGLDKRSSREYEDVYNKRQYSDRKVLRARYGRHSFNEERTTRVHRGTNGDLKDRKNPPGGSRYMERRDVGNMENSRYPGMIDVRDSRETRNNGGKKDTRNAKNAHEIRVVVRDIRHPAEDKGNIRVIRDTRYPAEDKGNIRDNNDRHRQSDTAKVNRGYARTTEITGEPSVSQDIVGKHSKITTRRNNINSVTVPSVGNSSSYPMQGPSQASLNLKSDNRKTPATKVPPPIAPKPIRAKPIHPMPQTSRPADSPTGSMRSNMTSNASSHGTQNSTASKKSVKSILKKPRVGRLVLREEPSSFTVLAMISCFLCFPFGIYTLVKSGQVKSAVEENDYETALKASKKVKSFCIGITIAYLVVLSIAGALVAKYFITGNFSPVK